MNQEKIGHNRARGQITDPVFVPEVKKRSDQCQEMKRPNPGNPVPDEVPIDALVQSPALVAIAIGQDKTAENEKEIDPKVASPAEAITENVIIE